MAQKRRGGYRAPADYDPNRGKGSKRRFGAARQQEKPERQEPADLAERRAPERQQRERVDRDRAGRDRVNGDRVNGEPTHRPRPQRESAGRERVDRAERAGSARVFAFDQDGVPKGQQTGSGASPPASAPEQPSTVPLETRKTTAADAADATFAGLGLGANIVRELGELGADKPFPIQAATIPDVLAGRDVLGRARTGSGKTIAFGAALVERMLKLKADGRFGAATAGKKKDGQQLKRGERQRGAKQPPRNPKALILAPTRELALQIDRTVQPIARSVGFFTAQLVGGVPIDPQVHALERGIDIVIGTPGRVLDLVNRRKLDLREVRISVIDEADHMCDLGFLEPVQRVLRDTVRKGQRLLFSATLDSAVQLLVDEFLNDPVAHEVEDAVGASGDAEHRVLVVLREHKDDVIRELAGGPGKILLFCRTKAYAERVTDMLLDAGINAAPLHGDLKQHVRERNLERFAKGKHTVLVATDVAARGIHIDDVDLVVQADPADDFKAYLHRAGRTARAGRGGRVVTVIPRTRQKRTREMLEFAGIQPAYFGDYPAETQAAADDAN